MQQPTWQQQPCPSWCVIEHGDEDHPHDRSHRDAGLAVPITARRRHFEGNALVEHDQAATLVVGRWQRDGDSRPWFFIGEDHHFELELSEESFARLAESMRALLGETARGPSPGPSAR